MADATFDGGKDDPRFLAAVDLVGRTGARELQIRWSDDEEPTVWFAVARYREGFECAAGIAPLMAMLRLLDVLIGAGAVCVHCRRPGRVSDNWQDEKPLSDLICWYVFDPETKRYRRSCEGVAKIGRNELCPCGSGLKFKRCHGGKR